MRTLRQMRSSFNDPEDVMYVSTFETVWDLLGLEFVRRLTTERKDFSSFALSGNTLMALYKDGFEWWVIGHISDISGLDLPCWAPKYRAQLSDGTLVTLTTEVVSSCGNKLSLRDGSTAIWIR